VINSLRWGAREIGSGKALQIAVSSGTRKDWSQAVHGRSNYRSGKKRVETANNTAGEEKRSKGEFPWRRGMYRLCGKKILEPSKKKNRRDTACIHHEWFGKESGNPDAARRQMFCKNGGIS